VLVQPIFAIDDLDEVRRTISRHGWALLVTPQLTAAHLPCLLDPEHDRGEELVIEGHIARADGQDLSGEVLLIFQGPQGYISADWYAQPPFVPTWNFVAVHVTGTPELLDDEQALSLVERTVDHFEAARERPWRLEGASADYARRIVGGVTAFRLRATKVEAKAKLSQDKPAVLQDRVIAALEQPGPYRNPALAAAMRETLTRP
jgi:transcriptional regulator